MLDRLPGEILLMIIDSPEVYRLISQVAPLGDSVIRGAKQKFALQIHKKLFKNVITDIREINYECQNNEHSTIKYLDNSVYYYRARDSLSLMTRKHIVLEPYNWVIAGGWIVRCTDSFHMQISVSDGMASVNLSDRKHLTSDDDIRTVGWASCYDRPAWGYSWIQELCHRM